MFDGKHCTANCYQLSGMVLDAASNSGLPSAEVKFYYQGRRGLISSNRSYLGSTMTYANGHYDFTFDGSSFKDGYYIAEAYKADLFYNPTYGNQVGTFDLDSVPTNVPYVQDFKLYRPTVLKIKAQTFSAAKENIYVNYGYGSTIYGLVIILKGQTSGEISVKTAGDMNTIVQYNVSINGTTTYKSDTVWVPSRTIGQLVVQF